MSLLSACNCVYLQTSPGSRLFIPHGHCYFNNIKRHRSAATFNVIELGHTILKRITAKASDPMGMTRSYLINAVITSEYLY